MIDSKQFVSIKLIPYPGHVGLMITSQSPKPKYSCKHPAESAIAKKNYDNYARWKNYITECGYKSPITKSYQEVSNVGLDSKKLILNTLQQLEVIERVR